MPNKVKQMVTTAVGFQNNSIIASILVLVSLLVVSSAIAASASPNVQRPSNNVHQLLSDPAKQAVQELYQGMMTTDPDTLAAASSLGEASVSATTSALSSPNVDHESILSDWQSKNHALNSLPVDPDAVAAAQAAQQVPQQAIANNSSTSVSPGQPGLAISQ